jgi:DNA-directed RNA polymerase subunit L
MKGSFIAGLKDDRIKYIVKAKGEDNSLAQLIETALHEESEVPKV